MVQDGHEKFRALLCIANGGSLMMPGRDLCPDSALGLLEKVLSAATPGHGRLFCGDPVVRIVVLNASQSTTTCRGGEQYPNLVRDRKRSRLVKGFETRWTICDLEDVVQQLPDRRKWPELEVSSLRCEHGFYGEPRDPVHFRKDVAKAAGDAVLAAARRTALRRHGGLDDGSALVVLAAGWNTNCRCYDSLSKRGECWRKAELVATRPLLGDFYSFLPIFQTFIGDFNHQKLPLGRL